ncbi:MAG: alpha/beta hydrolase [Acidimicrobiia bacterium]|nr:alpha/beta hydrolase [Acidimicrobiia bacterium]
MTVELHTESRRAVSRRAVPLRIVVIAAALLLIGTACDWRGPAPTDASIEASLGPFEYASIPVGSGHGFGGGTIWYPIADEGVDFGGVAVVPGFLSAESSISWYGPKLASNGFVVITIATNSGFDQPTSRGNQLLAALDYLTGPSPVADLVDADRLAVMGWSMGGGGALHAANVRPSLRAAVPLAGWHGTKDWSSVTVPTLVVACQNDAVAGNSSHSIPFYESLPDMEITVHRDGGPTTVPLAGTRAYMEVAGGSHNCVTEPNVTVARSVLPWLKRWVDHDTRYLPWICPAPVAAELPAISDYRSNCDL